jgi:hypothetical protein
MVVGFESKIRIVQQVFTALTYTIGEEDLAQQVLSYL